jgi:viologen exporter family transport system permease protein
MMTAVVSKYGAFARVAAAQARRDRGELFGRAAFFVVILGVFSSLWRAVAETGMPTASEPKALVWYLAATEWILLSAPLMHIEIQEAIRRGDVIYQLGRPVSYAGAMFAEGVGVLAARAPLLGVTAFMCAVVFTGWIPPVNVLVRVVAFGLIGAALITALHVWIGLLAFWLDDVSPVYWVWQKLMFVLGGLMLPIDVYPRFIQTAAAFTPFPSVLGGPASFVLHGGMGNARGLASRLAIWGCATALAVWWTFRRATSGLTVNGG